MNRDRDSALMALMGIPFVIIGAGITAAQSIAPSMRIGASKACALVYNCTLGPPMGRKYVPAQRVSFEDHEVGTEPYMTIEPARIETKYRIG